MNFDKLRLMASKVGMSKVAESYTAYVASINPRTSTNRKIYSMSKTAATAVQRVLVIGIWSYTAWLIYQMSSKISQGVVDHPTKHTNYREDMAKAMIEQDKSQNFYKEDDMSYLKNQLRADITTPEFKKKWEERQQQQIVSDGDTNTPESKKELDEQQLQQQASK
jgi:hypothetical protein